MAATFTVYADVPDALANGTFNVETTTLVGGNGTLSTTKAAGSTSISLNAGSNFSAIGSFVAWFLDGPNSESVAGATYSANTLTLPSPGTTYAHNAGVSVSSAGTQGCLASIIARASATVENICKQYGDGQTDGSLYQKSRTEILSGPSTFRAYLDRDHSLNMRPYKFPVASVSSASIRYGAMSGVALDLSNYQLPDNARRVLIPQAAMTGVAPFALAPYQGTWLPRNAGFTVSLTYTGGPVPSTASMDAVPQDMKDALYLLILDILARRQNQYGAAMIKRGDFTIESSQRGDTTGKSELRKQAERQLASYILSW